MHVYIIVLLYVYIEDILADTDIFRGVGPLVWTYFQWQDRWAPVSEKKIIKPNVSSRVYNGQTHVRMFTDFHLNISSIRKTHLCLKVLNCQFQWQSNTFLRLLFKHHSLHPDNLAGNYCNVLSKESEQFSGARPAVRDGVEAFRGPSQ